MQIELSITTSQYKDSVERVVCFLGTSSFSRLIEEVPFITTHKLLRTVLLNIVGKARMLSLNSTYRQKNTSTDVLSFELHEGNVLGELYICPDDIAKNARMLKHSFEVELLEIIIHGMLHLCMYDHSEEMFAWQEKINKVLQKEYETNCRTR